MHDLCVGSCYCTAATCLASPPAPPPRPAVRAQDQLPALSLQDCDVLEVGELVQLLVVMLSALASDCEAWAQQLHVQAVQVRTGLGAPSHPHLYGTDALVAPGLRGCCVGGFLPPGCW